jgi:Tfp pilus assembly protein PilO
VKAIGRVQSLAIAGVLILAIVAGGWFGLVKPAKSKVTSLKNDATTQESTNSSLRLQVSVLKSEAKHLPQQEAELARTRAKVPDQVELASLLRQLVVVAKDSGVNLTSLTPQKPVPLADAPGIESVDLTMSFTGGYAEIEQFDAGLEALTRTLMVKDWSLGDSAATSGAATSGGGASADGPISATFNGRVLVKNPNPTPATTTTPTAAASTTPTKS